MTAPHSSELGLAGNESMRLTHRREESRVLHENLFSDVWIVAESKERPPKVLCYRDGKGTG